MPVFDPAAIAGIIADLSVNILSYAGIALLLYSIGGILIRTVGWTFDKLLIGFIGSFYKYFETIINGELLTDPIVKGMMDRVYLLVGVFVVFRLGMLLFNYMLNPSEVMDEKVGVNALVKRVILGLILIIFMPNIFGFAFRLQKAILDDQVIERIIMSESDMNQVKKYKGQHGMGKIIGMTIFNGFFSVSSSGSNETKVVKTYNKAMNMKENYDLSAIDSLGTGLDSGILYKSGDDYAFDYFPIFSTVVLGYVLWLLIQYCLDAVVRSFKLSVLQVIAPICIVEYMINGDRNEVFKSWRKAVIATFAMLFMRVASIWFVAYITMLMQPDSGIESTSLLQSPDYLLKAIIVLGLLAFMMDFPKMMSDVFGLDLDQSGSVKNVMGKAMGAATAGLAIGGAAVGALAKPAKGILNVGRAGLGSALGNTKMGKKLSDWNDKVKNATTINGNGRGALAMKAMQERAQQEHIGTALKGSALAIGGAVLASNQFTKSAQQGYQQASSAVSNEIGSVKRKEEEEATAAYRQHQMQAADAQVEELTNYNINSGGKAQSDRAKAKIDAAVDFDVETDTVLGSLGKLNQSGVESLVQQQLANEKLDNISTNSQVTAEHTVNIDEKMNTVIDTTDNINRNVKTAVQTTNDISKKTDTVINHTKNISENTDTLVNQTDHISHQVDNIEDYTFYSGVDSINNMENSGYIDKPVKNLNDGTPKSTNNSKPTTNDDIETL